MKLTCLVYDYNAKRSKSVMIHIFKVVTSLAEWGGFRCRHFASAWVFGLRFADVKRIYSNDVSFLAPKHVVPMNFSQF